MKHLFVIRKYILASSAKDAIKKEKDTPVHDVWIEEKSADMFKQSITNNNTKASIGFK